MAVKKTPNPTDRHVGGRVRLRRMLVNMSQERLADALGVTFQQVQKYEKGANRISASRLQQIAKTLGAPVEFFFDGAPTAAAAAEAPAEFSESASSADIVDFLSTSEGVQLNRAFVRIRDGRVRRRIVDLVTAIAGEEAEIAS